MMKKLPPLVVMVLTPLLVCAGAGITYVVIARINPDFAKVVAAVILSSLVKVYTYLKDKEFKINFFQSLHGDKIRRNTSRWYLITVYSSLTLLGLINLFAAIGGVISGLLSGNPETLFVVLAFISVALSPIFFYFFGIWIGKRGVKSGILSIIITVVLVLTIDFFSFLLVPKDFAQELFAQIPDGVFSRQMIISRVVYICVCIVIALVGYLRGLRRRLVTEVQELFNILPRSTQSTIFDLVHEEAVRILKESDSEFAKT